MTSVLPSGFVTAGGRARGRTDVSGDSIRIASPMFPFGWELPQRASSLVFSRCDKMHAVRLVRAWHSRLPCCQDGPWEFAFMAEFNGVTYAVALWNTPSARCLPGHWLELRRMACSPDSPKNTASRFLGWMVRYFAENAPEREKCISYQDTAVHKGTIYKAAGWTAEHESVARVRDRSKNRVGTGRSYRSNLNGEDVDASPKIRWAKMLVDDRTRAIRGERPQAHGED